MEEHKSVEFWRQSCNDLQEKIVISVGQTETAVAISKDLLQQRDDLRNQIKELTATVDRLRLHIQQGVEL